MKLEPRFTNARIRRLQDEGIDLFKLSGEQMTDPATRDKILRAGCPDIPEKDFAEICDNLTPGEHIDVLQTAIVRDLIPASQREVAAKAAATDKSPGA